jgi:adenosylcobinamide-GDP ribazoletransferase
VRDASLRATRPRAGSGGAGAELRGLAAALAFLTRVPLGRGAASLAGEDVARAALSFPLVGALVGAAIGGTAAALSGPLSPLLAAALGVAVGTVLTGALHLDGLADSADALGASSRERALEIMRDHAVGAFGALALLLDVLVKTAALAALARHGHALAFAVVAGAASRWSPAAVAAALPYARRGSGTAHSFARTPPWRAVGAGALAAALAASVAGTDGLYALAVAAVATVALGVALRAWLGGVTGDTLGAAVELSEVAVLVAAVALTGAG